MSRRESDRAFWLRVGEDLARRHANNEQYFGLCEYVRSNQMLSPEIPAFGGTENEVVRREAQLELFKPDEVHYTFWWQTDWGNYKQENHEARLLAVAFLAAITARRAT